MPTLLAPCVKPVVEDHDEALLCEGTCDRWLHRYCAGVTETQYEVLQDSPLPFLCSICSQLKQAAVIKDMQEKIDSLTAEVIELRSNVTDLRTELQLAITTVKGADGVPAKSRATSSTWTEVVRHGKRQTVTSNASKHQTTHSQQRNASMAKPQCQGSVQSVSVLGARRIWGTLKSTTTRAAEKVITTVTKVSGSDLKIKRKYKTATEVPHVL